VNDERPFMLLRARPQAEFRAKFETWFRQVHLADVRKIPGIAVVESATTPAGTKLGFYTFEDTEQVQPALASPEAAYARGTWEQWAPHLEELQIEIFARLFPLPIYQSAS
jgi:hypothetical protein